MSDLFPKNMPATLVHAVFNTVFINPDIYWHRMFETEQMPEKDGQKLEKLVFRLLWVIQSDSLEIYIWINENSVNNRIMFF